SREGVVDAAQRLRRKSEIVLLHREQLVVKHLAVVELQRLCGQAAQPAAIQIDATKILESVRQLTDCPKGAVGIEFRLTKRRKPTNQRGADDCDGFKCLRHGRLRSAQE